MLCVSVALIDRDLHASPSRGIPVARAALPACSVENAEDRLIDSSIHTISCRPQSSTTPSILTAGTEAILFKTGSLPSLSQELSRLKHTYLLIEKHLRETAQKHNVQMMNAMKEQHVRSLVRRTIIHETQNIFKHHGSITLLRS